MQNTKNRSKKRIVQTGDGTNTMYSAEFDECYHSTRDGALHESLTKHVIPALMLQADKKELTILDICFGLGYNTLATLYYIRRENLDTKVQILSPEFDEELVRSLATFNYPSEFDDLRPIIEAISRNELYEDEQFRIDVLIGDAREIIQSIKPKLSTLHYPLSNNDIKPKFDIIYQDAFSPAKNPTLWTREWFADIREVCADDAVLTTYSVAAATRMGLYENGFELYEYRPEGARKSLIASPSPIKKALPQMELIDMELKIQRNPNARSLRDIDVCG